MLIQKEALFIAPLAILVIAAIIWRLAGTAAAETNAPVGEAAPRLTGVSPQQARVPAQVVNSWYAWDGATIRVTWEAADGADYYRVHYDDFFHDKCEVNPGGEATWCETLDGNVSGTVYVHSAPHDSRNYYWIEACNSAGCSSVTSHRPAIFADNRPPPPVNARYAREGSAIRVAWDAASGAAHYRVFHDDFFPDKCQSDRKGQPSWCELLAGDITETSYVHDDPHDSLNYYWISACNNEGCSVVARAVEAQQLPPMAQENEMPPAAGEDGETAIGLPLLFVLLIAGLIVAALLLAVLFFYLAGRRRRDTENLT